MIEDIRFVDLHRYTLSWCFKKIKVSAGYGLEIKVNGRWKSVPTKKNSTLSSEFFNR